MNTLCGSHQIVDPVVLGQAVAGSVLAGVESGARPHFMHALWVRRVLDAYNSGSFDAPDVQDDSIEAHGAHQVSQRYHDQLGLALAACHASFMPSTSKGDFVDVAKALIAPYTSSDSTTEPASGGDLLRLLRCLSTALREQRDSRYR